MRSTGGQRGSKGGSKGDQRGVKGWEFNSLSISEVGEEGRLR